MGHIFRASIQPFWTSVAKVRFKPRVPANMKHIQSTPEATVAVLPAEDNRSEKAILKIIRINNEKTTIEINISLALLSIFRSFKAIFKPFNI
jgi:hypothetical protein